MKRIAAALLIAVLAVPAAGIGVTAVSVVVAKNADAQASLRGLRRAIQKNTQIAVRRQLARLNINGSAGPVTAMNVSPDGRYMVSVSDDLTPRIWDLQEGRQIIKLAKLRGPSHVAQFLPDSQSFVTADDTGAIALWSIPEEKRIHDYPGHTGAVTALDLSADGTILASAGADGTVQVWSVRDGTPIAQFTGLPTMIRALDIGPTGEFVIGGGDDGIARVWELRTGNEVRALSGHRGPIRSLRFGQDETEFLSAGDDGTVRYWHTDKDDPVRSYDGVDGTVRSLAATASVDRLAAGTDTGAVVVWDFDSEQPVATLPAHDGTVRKVVFDGGGERLISAGDDAITRIWDVEAQAVLVLLISTKGGWAVVDDDGRFDGDDRALKDVEWVTDTQALPIDNFSEDYYEPGLLHKKRLGTGELMTAAARTMKDGILPPPLSEVQLPAAADGNELEVAVVTSDQGGGIEEVLLYHNGKVVPPSSKSGEDRRTENDFEVVTSRYRVRAVSGLNRFSATAISGEKVLGMFAEAETTVDIQAQPPKLHLMLVGINEYKDKRLNLNYGRPDAQAVRNAFMETRGGLFGDIVVHELYDQNATKDNIYATLETLRDTNPEDIVVIYIASHGVNLADEWYMVPHEFTLPLTKDKLRTVGLPSLDFRERMAQIQARRTFLMIDACKSGTATTAFEDDVDRRALRRLGRSVGMHVMAATANNQQAVEVRTLGHGVFTYTILNALEGQADTQPVDGNLTVTEIVTFAESSVPSLTQEHASHKQYPLTFSRGFDFTVSGYDG